MTHTEGHPPSWYAATLAYHNRYPSLDSDIEAEICVIGGGLSGVNTALELAERGHSVVLLEARQIGWGASGRNGGQLIRGLGHGLEPFRKQIGQEGIDAITGMGLEAVEIVRERVAKYNIDCDLVWGYADLANNATHMAGMKAEFDSLKALNYRHHIEMVPKERMSEIVGSDQYVGGMIDMGSGHVHPLNLVLGEAAAAADLGVQIFEGSEVIDIKQGHPLVIKTAKGTVTAQKAVICGNAYVGELNRKLGGKVLPAGSYVIATEPLDDAMAKRVLPQNMAVCDQKLALDYFRLSKDNRLLFGGLCNYSGRDPKSIEGVLKPHLEQVFPYLKDLRVDYQWGGMIGIGANRLPQIGRVQSNIYYAQAYSGHGLNATHMAARLIAESIHGESNRIEVFEKVSHMTFPGGRYLRSPLLATGMLYKRVMELLE